MHEGLLVGSVCAPRLPLGKIFAEASDDETLFAVAPGQGIPQALLKSLNLDAALQLMHSEPHRALQKIIRPNQDSLIGAEEV